MLKLYKHIDGQLHYWETWDKDERTGSVHWGVVGDRGHDLTLESEGSLSFHDKVQNLVNEKIDDGYRPVDDDDLYTLLIENSIEGMGTSEDLDKRHQLEDRMNETLGWTGLGHGDGGSIGSGTMEVCCFVVDFEIAKKVVENDLAGTEFENYSRIFDENAD